MKYRRKKVVEVEAYLVDYRIKYIHLPEWLKKSLEYDGDNFCCTTASGEIECSLPSWFIREPDDSGAYPVSVEYFAENFEAVEGGI